MIRIILVIRDPTTTSWSRTVEVVEALYLMTDRRMVKGHQAKTVSEKGCWPDLGAGQALV